MNFEYISKAYKVPAEMGRRIQYLSMPESEGLSGFGTIIGVSGAHIVARMDGDSRGTTRAFHPTWQLKYLDEVVDVENLAAGS